MWLLKFNWNKVLLNEYLKCWSNIQSLLSELDGLQLDRWIRKGSETVQTELHGFTDASTHAYAASIYIRTLSRSGEVATSLLIVKSKVAPIKSLSIPRLELAAAMLSQLLSFVRDTLLTASFYFCWADSTVVLALVTLPNGRPLCLIVCLKYNCVS